MSQISSKLINILNESSSLSSPFLADTTPKKLLGLTMNLTIYSLVEISMQSDLKPPQLANQSALATLHLKNRWQQFSIFSPHNTQLGSPSPILNKIFSLVGKAFCPIVHNSIFVPSGAFNLHNFCQGTLFGTLLEIWSWETR